MIGGHNSAIAQDYGMGIEEKFLKALLIPTYGEDKSEVVIANQRHSLLDQLRMGVRHLEVDVYHFFRLGGLRICHWPVFPPDFTILVNVAARQQGLYPLDWEPTNMGCDDKKPFLEEKLLEMRGWLDLPENSQELVGIYLDNKNVKVEHVEAFARVFLDVFGDIMFTPEQKNAEYPDRWPTVAELVTKNRRVYLENSDEEWLGNPTADRYFFTPTPWVQFGPERFEGYPNCSISGTNYYGRQLTRSLDGSLTLGPAFLWEGRSDYPDQSIIDMAKCSINIQSLDQITPDRIQHFVWSWERDQPNSAYSCPHVTSSGRWRTGDCARALPHACVSTTDETNWTLTVAARYGAGVCPTGYTWSYPETGFLNQRLFAISAGMDVWLNFQA